MTTRPANYNSHLDGSPHEAKGNCGTSVRHRTDLFHPTIVFRFRDAIQLPRLHCAVHSAVKTRGRASFNSNSVAANRDGTPASMAILPHPVMDAGILTDDSIRFLLKVAPANESGCRLWQASCGRQGYGDFWLNGRTVATHRTAWEFFVGVIPDSLHVLHKCDVRNCVNPAHLFLGTNQDNIDDKLRKGRQRNGTRPWSNFRPECKGEKNPSAKLTETDARLILSRHRRGEKPKALAKVFGVARSTIASLVCGDTWKHIPRAGNNSSAGAS